MLVETMRGMNAKSDPESEERKGGAGKIGKNLKKGGAGGKIGKNLFYVL